MALFKMTISDAIKSLQKITSVGTGPQTTQQQVIKAIEKVERAFPISDSAALEYWLGIAWRTYTTWFIRGENRKQYLEKAVMRFHKAYTLEKDNAGTDWMLIASELGELLIEESVIRDLDRGIPLLERVFQSTKDYEPVLCAYADGLYKAGDYLKTAEVAMELHRRAMESRVWKNNIPTSPVLTATKAYRAHIKQLKKEGKTKEAFAVSEILLQTGAATENDQRIHDKLAAR